MAAQPRASLLRSGLFILCTVSMLSACGPRAAVMVPSPATAEGASIVDMMVATTRAPSSEKGVLFTGERGADMSLVALKISIPPEESRSAGVVQWPRKLPADPKTEFSTLEVKHLKHDQDAESWFRAHRTGNGRVVIFVHGYKTGFQESVYRFAQVIHDSGATATPVVFSWPSRNRLLDYSYDKESANFSRDAFEEFLRYTVASPEVKDVTIVAHSMGAWLSVESLRQMAIREGRVNPKVRNVILASPDLDIDVAGEQWEQMGKSLPHFTLLISRDDRALWVSRVLSGNVDRLGQIDLSDERYSAALKEHGVTIIDLTDVEADGGVNHTKFAQSPEIVQLIGQRISGQDMSDNSIALSDRVGALVFGAGHTFGRILAQAELRNP